MRFKISYGKTSFNVALVSSGTDINVPKTDNYDWRKDTVYGSLSDVKKALRGWVKDSKLTAMDRRYNTDCVKDLTLEQLVDDLIEERN